MLRRNGARTERQPRVVSLHSTITQCTTTLACKCACERKLMAQWKNGAELVNVFSFFHFSIVDSQCRCFRLVCIIPRYYTVFTNTTPLSRVSISPIFSCTIIMHTKLSLHSLLSNTFDPTTWIFKSFLWKLNSDS